MSLDDVLTATREIASPDEAILARGRLSAVAEAERDISHRARIARRRSARRKFSIAAVAVAAGALAIIVIPSDDKPTSAPVARPAIEDRTQLAPAPIVEADYKTASQIVAAAAKGSSQSSIVLGDAPYWRVLSNYTQVDVDSAETDSSGRRTIWQGIDGPSVLNDTFGAGLTATGKTLALPQAEIQLEGRAQTWREINNAMLSPKQVKNLLTVGEAGTADKPGRAPHEWYYFKQAGELLAETPASPHVRQEIWKQLAKLTGVTTSGKATDRKGRSGWDLTMKLDGHGTQRFVVDPTSGAILESETDARGTTFTVTYLEAGPSDEAPSPTSR